MTPRVEPEGMLFRKPASTPDQVRGRPFRDHALVEVPPANGPSIMPPAASRVESYRQGGARHVFLGLAHRMLAEMEDAGGEHGAGMPVANAFDQMLQGPDAAGSDDRHRHRVSHSAGERDVEPGAGPIAIHGGEQNLPGAEGNHLAGVV